MQFYNLENLSGAQIYIYAIASHFLVCCKTVAVEEVILVWSVTIMSKKWCYRAASERKLRVCRSQPRVHSIEVRKQSGIIILYLCLSPHTQCTSIYMMLIRIKIGTVITWNLHIAMRIYFLRHDFFGHVIAVQCCWLQDFCKT